MEREIKMIYNIQCEGKRLAAAPEGRLDTKTAPEFEKELSGYTDDVTEAELDFAGLEYVSSAGLRVLLGLHKKMKKKGGKLVIRNVNESIMEIFEMTGFSGILTIE